MTRSAGAKCVTVLGSCARAYRTIAAPSGFDCFLLNSASVGGSQDYSFQLLQFPLAIHQFICLVFLCVFNFRGCALLFIPHYVHKISSYFKINFAFILVSTGLA
jgi:hypothetical protein